MRFDNNKLNRLNKIKKTLNSLNIDIKTLTKFMQGKERQLVNLILKKNDPARFHQKYKERTGDKYLKLQS